LPSPLVHTFDILSTVSDGNGTIMNENRMRDKKEKEKKI